MAAHGAKVAVNYVSNQAAADDVVEKIVSCGGQAVAIQGDVSRPEDAKRIVDQTIATYGAIHILVNNAGLTQDDLLLRMSEDAWDRVMSVNLRGAYLCTKAALRSMIRQRWGRIINVSSVAGLVGNPGQANYAAAKAGLIGFTKSVAKEVASRNVTANAIAPGLVKTEMTANLTEAQQQAAAMGPP